MDSSSTEEVGSEVQLFGAKKGVKKAPGRPEMDEIQVSSASQRRARRSAGTRGWSAALLCCSNACAVAAMQYLSSRLSNDWLAVECCTATRFQIQNFEISYFKIEVYFLLQNLSLVFYFEPYI